ncbi:hypothetical protein QJQ45_022092, partial [Haematococcus lacustris]
SVPAAVPRLAWSRREQTARTAVAVVLAAHPDLRARLEAVPRYHSDGNMVDHVGKQLETAFSNMLTLLFAGRLKKSVSLAGAKVLVGTHEHQRRFGRQCTYVRRMVCGLDVSWLLEEGGLVVTSAMHAEVVLRRGRLQLREGEQLDDDWLEDPANQGRLSMSVPKNSIMWFRKGLRLHDNPALLEACKGATHMFPVFIIDPFFLQNPTAYKVGVNRYNFLLESLNDLDQSFRARGSRLLVVRGKPVEVLPRLMKDWDITQLCFEVDTEPYATQRDAQVQQLAAEARVEVRAFVSHTLYDTAQLVTRNQGKAPSTMTSFCKLLDKVGDPPAPAPAPPQQLPPIPATAPGAEEEATGVPCCLDMGFDRQPSTIFKAGRRGGQRGAWGMAAADAPSPAAALNVSGGETEALKRLERAFADPQWIAKFEKPATDPSAFQQPATTVLSPYLKFGCVSARLFHQRLLQVYATHTGHSQPPMSLRGQLLWREFFYTVGAHTPNFSAMAGNPLCRQIPWQSNPQHLAAWREGRTGFPWIDAIMVQLNTWGWMHHLARHSVACFLTRGDLYLSWEEGQAVFEELLIDQDHFINAGNWMWLSASAFFSAYFRVYSPITFGKKYDKEGVFIRKQVFLPVLKDMPAKYIYEPWTAPLDVQRKAKCVVGKDYPAPIVDHAVVSKANIARMAAAYKAGSMAAHDDGGDEPEDGPARAGARSGSGSRKAASSPGKPVKSIVSLLADASKARPAADRVESQAAVVPRAARPVQQTLEQTMAGRGSSRDVPEIKVEDSKGLHGVADAARTLAGAEESDLGAGTSVVRLVTPAVPVENGGAPAVPAARVRKVGATAKLVTKGSGASPSPGSSSKRQRTLLDSGLKIVD